MSTDADAGLAFEPLVSTLVSPRYGFHCTTQKKLDRYKASGRIIAPVRFWPNRETAERWAKRTGRELIIRIRLEAPSFPLPDHKPDYWSPSDVLHFEC